MEKAEIVKILEDNIEQRTRDIEERQIDIDNYSMSLKIIDEKYGHMKELVEYKAHLEHLLQTSVLEQTKVKIFLEATKVNLDKLKN